MFEIVVGARQLGDLTGVTEPRPIVLSDREKVRAPVANRLAGGDREQRREALHPGRVGNLHVIRSPSSLISTVYLPFQYPPFRSISITMKIRTYL